MEPTNSELPQPAVVDVPRTATRSGPLERRSTGRSQRELGEFWTVALRSISSEMPLRTSYAGAVVPSTDIGTSSRISRGANDCRTPWTAILPVDWLVQVASNASIEHRQHAR